MPLWTGTGINPTHLLEDVIYPTLDVLDPAIPNTKHAALLLLGTAYIESRLANLRQEPTGPARSLWQIEGSTFAGIQKKLQETRYSMIRVSVESLLGVSLPEEVQLVGNLHYSCAVARCLYWFEPSALPTDPRDMYSYYRKVWKPGKPQSEAVFLEGLRKVPGLINI